MDYRDALAMNKYILEAKRHGDYHQQARARTLQLAMSRMNRLKRDEIDKRVKEELKNEKSEVRNDPVARSEKKLQMVMDEDNVVAQVYQEVYSDIKENAEQESNELKELHAKFGTYYDKEQMANKLDTEWYDPSRIDNYDQLDFSTEWTEEADDLMYKRYKMAKHEVETGVKEHDDLIN